MFVFSTRRATETGNLEANRAQFNELQLARNMKARGRLLISYPAPAGVVMRQTLRRWTRRTLSTISAACIALMIRLCWLNSNQLLNSLCLTT